MTWIPFIWEKYSSLFIKAFILAINVPIYFPPYYCHLYIGKGETGRMRKGWEGEGETVKMRKYWEEER